MWRAVCLRLSFISLLLNSLASCGSVQDMDPAYASKLRIARTDSRGKEIVGVWRGETHGKAGNRTLPDTDQGRFILLIKPDGTGILRQSGLRSLDDGTSIGYAMVQKLKWHHDGAGVWTIWRTGEAGISDAGSGAPQAFNPNGVHTNKLSVRLTDDALLWAEQVPLGPIGAPIAQMVRRWVFVRA